jgi:hypothetical protein
MREFLPAGDVVQPAWSRELMKRLAQKRPTDPPSMIVMTPSFLPYQTTHRHQPPEIK